MGAGPELRSERLLLRRWRGEDLEPFAELNADPLVMEHFPATLSREESLAYIERQEASFDAHGYGFWAVEVVGEGLFAGFVGLQSVEDEMPFAPALELGWRLARPCWGRGYATEAAVAATRFAFSDLGLSELLSYTAEGNLRSRRVMERLGMRRDPSEDFSHPKLEPGHPLSEHVLYRLHRPI